MREKNLSDQGHNSYIYQMCKRAPLPTYMRNENVIDKQALEWCSLGMQGGRQVGRQIFFGQVMSPHHSHQMSQRSQVSWFTLIASGVRPRKPPTNQGTRSPIELFWTAKKRTKLPGLGEAGEMIWAMSTRDIIFGVPYPYLQGCLILKKTQHGA